MKKMEAINIEITEIEQQIKLVEERNQSLRMVREDMMKELEDLRAQVDACQRENRQLMKNQEVSREEAAEMMGSRCKPFQFKLKGKLC